jgi:thymidylate kinase
MKIISISGLDGSGKSTQIKMLQDYLESQGKQVFYFHAIQFGIAQKIKEFRQKYCPFCIIMKKCRVSKKEESVTKSGKLGIALRKLFLKIDFKRFNKLIEKLEKEGFDYMLTDRYFYDSLVNIKYLSRFSVPGAEKIIKPYIAIYLRTDPEVIMQRERKPDQGIDYLKKKKGIYDKYATVWDLKIIDGNKSKEEIFDEIKELF